MYPGYTQPLTLLQLELRPWIQWAEENGSMVGPYMPTCFSKLTLRASTSFWSSILCWKLASVLGTASNWKFRKWEFSFSINWQVSFELGSNAMFFRPQCKEKKHHEDWVLILLHPISNPASEYSIPQKGLLKNKHSSVRLFDLITASRF